MIVRVLDPEDGTTVDRRDYEVLQDQWFSCSLGAAVAAAQETRGDISGTVTDPQGAIIPVATVTVTNVDTNVRTQVITNANGFYLAPLLITGNYQIVAEAAGFKKLVRSGLSLRLGQHMEINLTMEVGHCQ